MFSSSTCKVSAKFNIKHNIQVWILSSKKIFSEVSTLMSNIIIILILTDCVVHYNEVEDSY